MTSIVRVATVVNRVYPADSTRCLAELWLSVKGLAEKSPDIILFPQLALSGVSCGSFFDSGAMLDDCRVALEQLCVLSASTSGYIVAGLPADDAGRSVSAMAVIHDGKLIGLVPSLDPPAPMKLTDYSDAMLPVDTVFGCGNLRFCLLPCNADSLALHMHRAAATGCDLVLVPSLQPATMGSQRNAIRSVERLSRDWGVAVAVANAGVGESASPHLYRGWCGVWENGVQLALSRSDNEAINAVSDIDTDIIRATKRIKGCKMPICTGYVSAKGGLLRRIEREPFLNGLQDDDLLEIFDLQARSLATRMRSSGMQRAILGVSGGLDSTLAMMVASRAVVMQGLPTSNLIGVTMPGFGTSGRTYNNAIGLIDALGAQRREVDIREACSKHYRDIGLDEQDRGVAYENAQARERTQILMDIGNMENAIVVGTGDLSEMALGWCTFGGDHLAGYGVNSCLTKGMVRLVCAALAGISGQSPEVRAILNDVLATPVSPELLPPTDNGEIAQKSEDILGPYELHDFFLFYIARYGMRLSKVYNYACIAFAGDYSAEYIRDRLVFFAKRFCRSQFKRSCQTDGAVIAFPNLSPSGFTFPADLSPDGLLGQLAPEN